MRVYVYFDVFTYSTLMPCQILIKSCGYEFVCVCVCVCVCVRVYILMCLHTPHSCLVKFSSSPLKIYVCVCVCVRVYVYFDVCTYSSLICKSSEYVCVCVGMCVCACVYTF